MSISLEEGETVEFSPKSMKVNQTESLDLFAV